MKRLGSSVVLIVLAALAVVYLLVVERRQPSDAERALRAQSVVPLYRPEELATVVLDRPGDTVTLTRAPATWSLDSSAGPTPADTAAVEALLGVLASASVVRVVSPETPAATLGAERASVQLTFAAADGARTVERLSLRGEANGVPGAAYVVRDDRSIVVASAELVTELLMPRDRFRDRVVAPYPLTRLSRLVERLPGRHLELARSGTDTFRLADGRRASRATTDALAVALADLRFERFLPPTAASAPVPVDPRSSIELDPSDPHQPAATLNLGAVCPDHEGETVVAVASPRPVAGCVTTRALAALSPADDALEERHLFQAKTDEVSALLLRTPAGQLDLARKGAGWHQRAPVDRDLDPGEADAATALVEALVAAEGTPAPLRALSALEGGRREHVATLRAGEPAVDEEVVWAPAGAGVETRDLALGPEVRALLEPTARSVKPLTLWSPPLDPARVAAVDAVTIGAASCPGHEQRIERRAGAWSLVRPLAVAADQAAVIDLLDAVSHARARRWTDHEDLGACAGVTLFAGADGGAEPLGCLGFAPHAAGDGAADVAAEVVQAGGAPSYARIDAALAERACRWFVDRHVFALPADASSVTLVRGSPPARVVPLSSPGLDAAPDDSPAARALAVLDGLVADDVMHLGPPVADDHLAPPELAVEARTASGTLVRWSFGAVLGGARRATVSGVPAVFALSAGRLEPLFAAFSP